MIITEILRAAGETRKTVLGSIGMGRVTTA